MRLLISNVNLKTEPLLVRMPLTFRRQCKYCNFFFEMCHICAHILGTQFDIFINPTGPGLCALQGTSFLF